MNNSETEKAYVESEPELARRCIAKIRDIATMGIQFEDPWYMGYILQEIGSALSDYTADETILFTHEDDENEVVEGSRGNCLHGLHEEMEVLNAFLKRRHEKANVCK